MLISDFFKKLLKRFFKDFAIFFKKILSFISNKKLKILKDILTKICKI